MGGVDLADILLSLYQILCKTNRWYQKISGISLICQRPMRESYTVITFVKLEKPNKDHTSLLQFILELSDALILTNKVNPSSSGGRTSRRRSLEAFTMGKKSTQAFPVTDVRFDQIAHWSSPSTNKNRWRCSKMECNVPNTRSFTVYWLIAFVSLISIQNHVLTFFEIEKF